MKILCFANALSLAHPTRMWSLANLLEENGHDVHFATSRDYFRYLLPQKQTIRLHHISAAPPTTFNDRLYKARFIFARDEFERDTLEDNGIIREVKPDIIFSDLRPTAYISSKLHGIPFFNVTQLHWMKGFENKGALPPVQAVRLLGRAVASIFSPLVSSLILKKMTSQANNFFRTNALARSANIPEFKCLSDFYMMGDHVLFADLQYLYPTAQIKKSDYFLGPLVWKNTQTPWPEGWPREFTGKPLAYVTMGSTGSNACLSDILDGLRDNGYQIILSTYGYNTSLLNLADTHISPFVPGEEALKRASLIVCNGGTGTTYHALSHGVPILSVPQNMDQALHGMTLENNGLAKMIYADLVKPHTISSAISQLVSQTSLHAKLAYAKEAMARSTAGQLQSLNRLLGEA